MAPRGQAGDPIGTDNPEYYVLDPTDDLLQVRATLEKDQYYKIELERNQDDCPDWVMIDIVGDNYEKADQKRLMNLKDDDPFVIIRTDKECPDGVWVRALGHFDANVFSGIRVSPWITE